MLPACHPLPRLIRDLADSQTGDETGVTAPRARPTCRTVTVRVDLARLTADLEQELRVALDGAVVGLVAGRIRR
jgi:hypothetical protein